MNTARPACVAADRPWPPRRAAPPTFAGDIQIVGQLTHDAELRLGAGGAEAVLRFEIQTGKGFPYEVVRAVPGTPAEIQSATALQHALRRGTSVRVYAHGAIPRTDHGTAVLRLIEVTHVVPMKDEV